MVNLHPELLVPAGEEHQDFSFPWLGEMTRIVQHAINTNPKLLDQRVINAAATNESLKLGQLSQEWTYLNTAWNLYNRGKSALADGILQKHYVEDAKQPDSVPDWIIQFTKRVVGVSADRLFGQLTAALYKIRRSGDAYQEYCKFVRAEHRAHIADYQRIYIDFMKSYSEYSQVLLYVYSGLEIPDDFHATSHAFQDTQMFYGNAFEVLTSRLVVLATLSNVLKGRAHDQFQRLPGLKAYRELKKESKCGPFSDTPDLSWICEELDTTLRNASHHAAIHYDVSDAMITYRSGGTGAEQTISYAQYLLKCFDMFRRLGTLLQFEITISQIADQHD